MINWSVRLLPCAIAVFCPPALVRRFSVRIVFRSIALRCGPLCRVVLCCVVLCCGALPPPSFFPSSSPSFFLLSFVRSLTVAPFIAFRVSFLAFPVASSVAPLLRVMVRYVAFCCVAAFDFVFFSVLPRALANDRRHVSHQSFGAGKRAPDHVPSTILPRVSLRKQSRRDRRGKDPSSGRISLRKIRTRREGKQEGGMEEGKKETKEEGRKEGIEKMKENRMGRRKKRRTTQEPDIMGQKVKQWSNESRNAISNKNKIETRDSSMKVSKLEHKAKKQQNRYTNNLACCGLWLKTTLLSPHKNLKPAVYHKKMAYFAPPQ